MARRFAQHAPLSLSGQGSGDQERRAIDRARIAGCGLCSRGPDCRSFPPGRYTIDGGNTPILSKLGAWKYGFNSPFKAEVYFVNTKQFTDLKWGTPNPVMMRDTDFGMVRLRAFGIYSMRVADPQAFIKEIAGTNAHFVTEDIEGQLKRTLVGGFSDALGESKIAALDLASNYDELGKFTRGKLNEEFKTFGLELTKFVIENISLPQEVEAAMDKRTSMGVIGDVGRYAQFQAADAMRDAAQNPGGGAGTGVGLGAGFAIGNAMAGAMTDAMKQSKEGATRRPQAATSGRRALSEVWSSKRARRKVLYGVRRETRDQPRAQTVRRN